MLRAAVNKLEVSKRNNLMGALAYHNVHYVVINNYEISLFNSGPLAIGIKLYPMKNTTETTPKMASERTSSVISECLAMKKGMAHPRDVMACE